MVEEDAEGVGVPRGENISQEIGAGNGDGWICAVGLEEREYGRVGDGAEEGFAWGVVRVDAVGEEGCGGFFMAVPDSMVKGDGLFVGWCGEACAVGHENVDCGGLVALCSPGQG